MREARDGITLSRVQREGAEAAQTVAEKAYEVGRGTAIEVQAAQRETRAARGAEIRALYDLQTAAAEFLYAQGEALPAQFTTPSAPPGAGR
jgi:outer membrane protein TolC